MVDGYCDPEPGFLNWRPRMDCTEQSLGTESFVAFRTPPVKRVVPAFVHIGVFRRGLDTLSSYQCHERISNGRHGPIPEA
jgi:hypothetical protein